MMYYLSLLRCIADHHREGQFPFLDEEVVAYLQQLPVHCKVGARSHRILIIIIGPKQLSSVTLLASTFEVS